jgi:hypothetical protein
MVVSVAPANSTHVMSVLGMNDAEEGVARRHPGSIKPMRTDSAAPQNGIIVSPTASPQLERGLGCGGPARAHDSEPHPEPASPEACSTTELYSAGGQAGGEWRVHCHKASQSTSTLPSDRAVADDTATHAKDQALGAVLCAEPHLPAGTFCDALTASRCDRGATAAARTLYSRVRATQECVLLLCATALPPSSELRLLPCLSFCLLCCCL